MSVVIPTHNRCELCIQAVSSALEQEPAPLEVFVCDDGSTDETQARLEALQQREPRLTYLRLDPSRGRPAPARNLGIAKASAHWVAFLDDDDRWRPGKLAVQAPLLARDVADVLATDAIRTNGERYLGLNRALHATRSDIERDNPVILSSAVVKRSLLVAAGGFDERLACVEDYELWLRLADNGARFLILDASTVDYNDHDGGRLSSARLHTQRVLLRARIRRWLRAPASMVLLRSALREGALTLRMLVAELRARRKRRLG